VLEWIRDREHLRDVQEQHKDFFALAFWGKFSEAAERALAELKAFAQEYDDVPLYVVDVQKVRGIHKEFDVQRVPTVVAVENGGVTRSTEGVQSARFYALYFAGAAPSRPPEAGGRQVRHVTVYSGPGCPPCGLLKTYLRTHGISFREIDIARRPEEAEKLRRRSGYMAVPQTDINGRLVVGFDPAKLAPLLGIQSERRS